MILVRKRRENCKSFSKHSWFGVPAGVPITSAHFLLYGGKHEKYWKIPFSQIKRAVKPVNGMYRVSVATLEAKFERYLT